MFAVVLVDDVRYQEREGRVSRERRAPGEFLRQNSACDFLRVRRFSASAKHFLAFQLFLVLGLGPYPHTSEHEVKLSAWSPLRLPLRLTALLALVPLPQAAAAAAHVAAVIDHALSLSSSKDVQTSPCSPASVISFNYIYDKQSINLSLVWLLGRSWPCKPQPSYIQAFRRSNRPTAYYHDPS
jgi:hypothetical protein